MALITLARATELVPNFSSSDNTVMTDIVNAASDCVERYCNRRFALTTYDELLDGTGDYNIFVSNYPITALLRVAYNPIQVMSIRNTDTGCARATFRIDGTSASPPLPNVLYLVSMKNGVETAININLQTGATSVDGVAGTTFTMVTLDNLATAINSFAGWAAGAMGIFTSWRVDDIRPPQGANECRWFGNAYLKLHSWNLADYEQNPDVGEIVSPQGFTFGYRNYRIIYTAGYSTIPEPVQQAVADLAVAVYVNRGVNPNLTAENLGGYSYSQITEKTFHQLDLISRYSLPLYKSYRVAKYKLTI